MRSLQIRQFILRGAAAALCAATALSAPASVFQPQAMAASAAPARQATRAAAPAQPPVRLGVTRTITGVTVSAAELRLRSQAAPPVQPRQARQGRTAVAAARLAGVGLSGPLALPGGTSSAPSGPDLPQVPTDTIVGPTFVDSDFVPPDTMGAVGPTDFLFTENGVFRGFLKDAPHTQVFTTTDVAFWGGVADPAGVSDPHVRYDRSSGRWFITEIDVPNSDNNILLAVSSGPDLATASWSEFALPATANTAATDQHCFADYDTPGIDQNAIYIGANMFGGGQPPCGGGSYKHSNLYIIKKSSMFSGTANVTSFYSVVTGTVGIETIQGVDSFDALPTGYAVAVNESANPRTALDLWHINNPASLSPSLSGPVTVTISAETGPLGGVLSANNVASLDPTRGLDDLDDRLFAAVIRDGHLWTAHNVAVDASGNASAASPNRDAVRWYDLDLAGPTVHQSGTVFDGAANSYTNYWMGSIMPSGQGHVALGLNRAMSTTVVAAGAVGRLASDALGTMRGFSLIQNSTADKYDDASFNPNPTNRWGDYTYTSLDPCDDMSLWTTQEYIAGSLNPPSDWGVVAARLPAPPPATLAAADPNTLTVGLNSVSVVVTGTVVDGSGFYNTPDTLTDPCRKTISATVSNGVSVTGISYLDPTHVRLTLSTVAALGGTATITVTNPDGQSAAGALLALRELTFLPLMQK